MSECTHPDWRISYLPGKGVPVDGPLGSRLMQPECAACGALVQVGAVPADETMKERTMTADIELDAIRDRYADGFGDTPTNPDDCGTCGLSPAMHHGWEGRLGLAERLDGYDRHELLLVIAALTESKP